MFIDKITLELNVSRDDYQVVSLLCPVDKPDQNCDFSLQKREPNPPAAPLLELKTATIIAGNPILFELSDASVVDLQALLYQCSLDGFQSIIYESSFDVRCDHFKKARRVDS